MKKEAKLVNLQLSDYEQKGLYLIFPDSSRLVLTRENIERVTEEFWKDPARIPPKIKETSDFKLCPICPFRGEGLCFAIRPILPFLEAVDKYVSYNKVTAVYKGEEKQLYHISDTTMQDALKYVSILSLTHYCQTGRKYWKYFFGVIPLMGAQGVATRLYLNIYWLHKGKIEEIENFISKFNEEIRITSENQVKRLNLICKNDAFMNAFVSTQVTTEFLTMDIEKILEAAFDAFEKSM